MKRDLRSTAEAYAAAKGIELSTLGQRAADDWRFFTRLADGKTFTVRKYDEVMGWFAANWPKGVAWPAGVTRPGVRSSRVRKRAA